MKMVLDFIKKYSHIEIEVLLAFVLKRSKEFLFMRPKYRLTRIQASRLTRMIKRREKGEPIAYIIGYKDFMGRRFKVNKNVLIPRPETEWLVEKIVLSSKYYVSSGKPFRVLDVGTGSGCIAVSLAKGIFAKHGKDSLCHITASDISEKALSVAKANAKAHKVQIKFLQSDLFENIEGRFDVIVANLPYVPKEYYVSRSKYLGWEPKAALVDPVKDFDIYKRFFEQVPEHLNPGGVILLEIDPSSRKLLRQYQKRFLPKAKIKFHKDFNNLWRYTEVKVL